ncbi:hypothetical protein BPA_0110100 [Borrelia parkeri SLO]|uniref:Variable outer membrane protein n=1 Tax=Borrelia parkeri SLO TaxID=1313294 RepID=A0ABM5PJF9_BORPR|nr:hypothetical protein BPA_0110100 [Borrelia parkeri SLO]
MLLRALILKISSLKGLVSIIQVYFIRFIDII